jgi:hypothetical protein
MFAPLQAVVTYRGRELIRGDLFHWTVTCTEWKALVFGRWVADIHFRGLLWELPHKVRSWINQLGISGLLHGIPLSLVEAQTLLAVHYVVKWTQHEVVISDFNRRTARSQSELPLSYVIGERSLWST